MITSLFAIILTVHALIHLLGAAKGLGWADLPQLTQAVSRPAVVLWLLAGVIVGYLHDGPRSFNTAYARDVAVVLTQPGRNAVLSEVVDVEYNAGGL